MDIVATLVREQFSSKAGAIPCTPEQADAVANPRYSTPNSGCATRPAMASWTEFTAAAP